MIFSEKVYVVWKDNPEWGDIVSIWKTREQAQKKADKYYQDGYSFSVKEFRLRG
jgi:hypothetical protein